MGLEEYPSSRDGRGEGQSDPQGGSFSQKEGRPLLPQTPLFVSWTGYVRKKEEGFN